MRHVIILSFALALATGLTASALAQEPAIPSLLPLKPKKSAAPKLPSLKPAPKREKAAKAEPAPMGIGQQAVRLLSDFRKTQKFQVSGPAALVVEVRYTGKKPKIIKFIVARGGKQEALLKVEGVPVTQRLEVPEGSHKYTMVAMPPRKLEGKITVRVEALGEEAPLVAAAEPGKPGEPDLAAPPTAPPPAPEAPGAAVSDIPPAVAAAAAPTSGPPPRDAVRVNGRPSTLSLTGNKQRPYYQIDGKQPVSLTVRGPASIWFELRRNVKAEGGAAQPLAIEGRLNNELVWTFRTRAIASQDRYEQTSQVVPGVREHVQLSVPVGEHACELRLADGANGHSAAVAIDYSAEGSAPIMLVQRGAYLSGIAQGAYGRDDYWPAIYEVNRDQIGADPNKVEVGVKLVIPSYDDAKMIMKWLASGKLGSPPTAIAKLKGATPGLAGGEFVGGQLGDSFRRYLDHAVKDQVQMYLQAMVQSGAMEHAAVDVEMGDAGGFDVGDVVVKVDDAPIATEGARGMGRVELLPGPHRMDVFAKLRGGSVFSYMKTTSFDVQGGHGFFVQAGKQYRARINVRQGGDITREFKDRIQVQIELTPLEKSASLAPAAKPN